MSKNNLKNNDVNQGNLKVDFNDADIVGKTPILNEEVTTETEMKEWMVNYVGSKHTPENNSVTVEMIVETMAEEFPEFLMAIAEENWVRGYHQALQDVDIGENEVHIQDQNQNEQETE
jgi:hypothetical protein